MFLTWASLPPPPLMLLMVVLLLLHNWCHVAPTRYAATNETGLNQYYALTLGFPTLVLHRGWAWNAVSASRNDLGGTLINENISRAAGASHGQEMTGERFAEFAASIGRPIEPSRSPR